MKDVLAAAQELLTNGKTRQAINLLRKAVTEFADDPQLHLQFGDALFSIGDVGQAIGEYRTVISCEPSCISAHINLHKCLSFLGLHLDALITLHKTLHGDPTYALPESDIGNQLRALMDKTNKQCEEALVSSSDDLKLHKETFRSFVRLEYFEAADRLNRRILELDPDDGEAKFRSKISFENQIDPQEPPELPQKYIQNLFDMAAESFDEHLTELKYCAPQLTTDVVSRHRASVSKPLAILDAGCGTGLCGPMLRPHAGRLVGVDLSSQMLVKATARDVYDELIQDDLTVFLASCRSEDYDIVVSADVFVYFGNLSTMMSATYQTLRPGGLFIFTVEAWKTELKSATYHLPHKTFRYRHSHQYLAKVVEDNGFSRCEINEVELRYEDHQSVDGYLVIAYRDHVVAKDL